MIKRQHFEIMTSYFCCAVSFFKSLMIALPLPRELHTLWMKRDFGEWGVLSKNTRAMFRSWIHNSWFRIRIRFTFTAPSNNAWILKLENLTTKIHFSLLSIMTTTNGPPKKRNKIYQSLHERDLWNQLKWTSVSWDISAKMIDGSEKRNVDWAEFTCYLKAQFKGAFIGTLRGDAVAEWLAHWTPDRAVCRVSQIMPAYPSGLGLSPGLGHYKCCVLG